MTIQTGQLVYPHCPPRPTEEQEKTRKSWEELKEFTDWVRGAAAN